jgi:hypothetical protein
MAASSSKSLSLLKAAMDVIQLLLVFGLRAPLLETNQSEINMKIFLSWSGESSMRIAVALNRLLMDVFPFKEEVSTWMSTETVPGVQWRDELDKQLQDTHFGVICLSADNLNSPWLLFEAGALSKSVETARVVPYCFGISPNMIGEPLSAFQGVSADKTGTLMLLESINAVLSSRRSGEELTRVFERWWPDLGKVLTNLPPSQEMLDLPAELNQPLLARRDSLGHKQDVLLRVLLHNLKDPDTSIEQSAILEESKKDHLCFTESELYYRLEQLRLLGFIMKEPIPGSKSHRYRLSSVYRQNRDSKRPL